MQIRTSCSLNPIGSIAYANCAQGKRTRDQIAGQKAAEEAAGARSPK